MLTILANGAGTTKDKYRLAGVLALTSLFPGRKQTTVGDLTVFVIVESEHCRVQTKRERGCLVSRDIGRDLWVHMYVAIPCQPNSAYLGDKLWNTNHILLETRLLIRPNRCIGDSVED